MKAYIVAVAIAFAIPAARAGTPDVRDLGGWALVFDPPGKITNIFVADEAKQIMFGFACFDAGKRMYVATNGNWQDKSYDGKTEQITLDINCDGQEIEAIPFRFVGKTGEEYALKPANPDAPHSEQLLIESDRNVLSAIQSAKRYCSVTIGNQTLELPLSEAAGLIQAYIYSCKALGRW